MITDYIEIASIKIDGEHLAEAINKIGYINVYNILPSHEYDGTLYIVLYKKLKEDKQ